jgi:hypothetical protein
VTLSAPRVTISTSSTWRLRLMREIPRYLLAAVALSGLAASARFAVAPPRPAAAMRALPAEVPDGAAEAYAALFARRLLSWNSAEPLSLSRSLEPFLGAGQQADIAVQLPSNGAQSVAWAEVVQAREPQRGVHVYTVAAQTDAAGLLYLAVGVTRLPSGALALSGAPAFVGPPASAVEQGPKRLRAVEDPALEVVVRRALTNYLSGQSGELASDLTPTARVSLPTNSLILREMGKLGWAPGGGAVVGQVQASDPRGATYTLAYEVDVVEAQGRWEISAVQMDPDAK